VDNINTDLGEAEWCCVDWTGLTQEKEIGENLVNMAINLRIPEVPGLISGATRLPE
jgi:hypothetical protein